MLPTLRRVLGEISPKKELSKSKCNWCSYLRSPVTNDIHTTGRDSARLCCLSAEAPKSVSGSLL